jgi:hypothetical protein
MSWIWWMFVASAAGSVFAVFWPTIVGNFKDSGPTYNTVVSARSRTVRFVAFAVLGVVIGVVVAALGFATFLGSAENRAALEAAGIVSYFSAFTAGFASGSLFEEPLKQ